MALMGLAAGICLVENIPGYLQGDTLLGARNISMCLVMVLALISRNPFYIGFAFVMRLLTEVQDTITTFFNGFDPMGIMFIIIIVLEILTLIKIKKLILAEKQMDFN